VHLTALEQDALPRPWRRRFQLKVQVVYRGLLSSVLGIFDGGTISAGGTWKPSPALGMLGGLLPLLTTSVSFHFTAINGAAAIDDVYLDPMKSS
jgi:hypothetical protein